MTNTDTAQQPATGRLTVLMAFLWSLLAVPIGLWQLLDPEGGPFSHELYQPTIVLPDAVPDFAAPAALIAAGIGGLLIARAKPWLWPLTALYAMLFGLLLTTTTPIALVGYLCAFAIPIVAIVGPVMLVRNKTARLIAFAAMAALVIGLTVQGVIDLAAIGDFLGMFGGKVAAMAGFMAVQAWTVAGGAVWALLTVHLLRLGHRGEPTPGWLTPERAAKWGKAASWIAFACALPYGLLRMTWLTPWPLLGGPLAELDLTTRIWGLCLGFAAIGGGVLCLGLTQRWGERWPYWMPVLKGRPVPPRVAIVPASVVAALFTFTAVPFLALGFRQGEPEMTLAFPFYLWGPALAAATLAYAIRRGAIKPFAA